MPRAKTAWSAVLAATLCGVVVAMNIGKVPIALPQMRDELGLSLVAAGWVMATLNTVAVFSGVFIGMLAGRVGALRFCLLGLIASGIGGALGIVSLSQSGLLVSRVVEGIGFIAVAASAPALVSAASTVSQHRLVFGIWSSFMPTGASLAILLAPAILASAGWRGLWWLVLMLLGVSAFAVLSQRSQYRDATPRPREESKGAKHALRHPAPWLLALAFAAYAVQFFAVVTWLPTFLQEQRSLPAGVTALLSTLVIVVNVPGNLLGGLLLHRNTNRGRLIAGTSLAMGLAGFGIFSDALPDLARYGLCLLLTLVGGTLPPAVLSSSASLATTPKQIGTLQGLFLQGSNIGQFVGTPLVAAVVAASGHWQSALAVTGTAAAIGVIAGLLISRMRV